MKTKIFKRKGYISLELVDPQYAKDDRPVLAAGTEQEGTGCWMIADIRLGNLLQLSPFGCSISAEDVYSRFLPDSPDIALLAKTKLSEYCVTEDGTIEWCTYRNFRKGSTSVRGYTPMHWSQFAPAIYHSRTAVTAYLRAAQQFWEAYEGPLAEAAIPNPDAQPRENILRFLQYSINDQRQARMDEATSGSENGLGM